MTQEEVDKIVADHEGRLEAIESALGIEASADDPTQNPREAAHQALVARIHGEKQ